MPNAKSPGDRHKTFKTNLKTASIEDGNVGDGDDNKKPSVEEVAISQEGLDRALAAAAASIPGSGSLLAGSGDVRMEGDIGNGADTTAAENEMGVTDDHGAEAEPGVSNTTAELNGSEEVALAADPLEPDRLPAGEFRTA
jgi:hypothetical protein